MSIYSNPTTPPSIVDNKQHASIICPLWHPAAIIRGADEQGPIQVEYLKRCKQWLEGGHHLYDISQPLPGSILYPTLADLDNFYDLPILQQGLAIDIEAAGPHIICIGMTRMHDLHYLCLRFLLRCGIPYWLTWDNHYKATAFAYNILAEPTIPKVFHNGQAFDVIELEELGFKVNGFVDLGFDTLLAQAAAMPGFPKSLQFCATFHLGFPAWKQLVKQDDEEGEGK